MATEPSSAVFGLAEHELRSQLQEELVRAMRAEGRWRRCTRSPTALLVEPDEGAADHVESGSQ